MKKSILYPKEWLAIHPYTAVRPSDAYYVTLANELLAACTLTELPEPFRRKLCLYVAAYVEDVVSGLGLWRCFTKEHTALYGKPLPFRKVSADWLSDEVNEEDVAFLIWNTWQKATFSHGFVSPLHPDITRQAAAFRPLVERAYEEAPENEALAGFWDTFATKEEAERKLTWLFGHTYLTEPSMQPYIAHVAPRDRFIVPTGPLALFLYEWTDRLAADPSCWKEVEGLYASEPEVPERVKEQNRRNYELFTAHTQGREVAYLPDYEALRGFLTGVLQWPDDDNHTLPQFRAHRDFVLLVNREKGILLAKDVAACIADPDNPLYRPEEARRKAFRLLTEEMLCPPDLLHRCIANGWLPDASLSGEADSWVQENADFIARHTLLYYYRGD